MSSLLRCAICAARGLPTPPISAAAALRPVAGPSSWVSLSPAPLKRSLEAKRSQTASSSLVLPSSRRHISFVPRKTKRRVSYKIHQPKWSGTSRGTTLRGSPLGDGTLGLRTIWPSRIKQATFVTMHQHLQRHTKAFKDVKIAWKRFPYRGQAEKGSEVKMGKGRGAFSYLADNVPGGRVLLELTAPGMTKPQMWRALRAVKCHCPAKCEIIDRFSMPKVGLRPVPRNWRHPHNFLRGAHPEFGIVKQGLRTDQEVMEELESKATLAAAGLPTETITITQGPRAGQTIERVMRTAPPSEWRKRMLQIYARPKDVRARLAAEAQPS